MHTRRNKIRVLVYTSLFPSASNPTHGIFVSELCNSLIQYHDLYVLVPVDGLRNLYEKAQEPSENIKEGIKITYKKFYFFPKILKELDARLQFFFLKKKIKKIFQSFKPDIIHAHYAYPEGVAASFVSKKYSIPLVVTIHGSDINFLLNDCSRNRLIINMLKEAAAIVGVSQALCSKVKKATERRENIYHIPNGVNLKKFFSSRRKVHAAEKAKSRHKIIGIGRLERIKAFDNLIKSLIFLPDNIDLIIAGEGTELNNLFGLAEKLQLKKRVSFAGSILHSELRSLINKASLLAVPSHMEGWPTVIYEAFACGIPVVAHSVGGIPEIIRNSNLGILCPSNEPKIFAQCIQKALQRHWNPNTLIEEARKNSWDKIALQYSDLYREILSSR